MDKLTIKEIENIAATAPTTTDKEGCGCETCSHALTAQALRQLLEERRWRPIETAPGLDGDNRILVWSSQHPPSDQVQFRLADGEFWRREKVGPSHWMPLPLPPSPEENGD